MVSSMSTKSRPCFSRMYEDPDFRISAVGRIRNKINEPKEEHATDVIIKYM